MKRISTDAEYLNSGKIVLDADGIPLEPASKSYVDQQESINLFTATGSAYAATLLPQAGVDAMQILEAHRNWSGSGSSTILAIPDGVSQISATYNGPQAMAVYLRRSDGTRTEIMRIEAGAGWRRSPIISIPAISAGEALQMFLSPAPSASDASTYRGSVMVAPIPTPTGS